MRRRRFIVVASLTVLALVAGIALTPVWFPWVLSPILASHDVSYASYRRDGATRLILEGVTNARGGYRFSAKQIDVLTPTAYLWQRWFGTNQTDVLTATDWQLELGLDANRSAKKTAYQHLKKTESIAAILKRWVSKAVLRKGAIVARRVTIDAPSVQWKNGSLAATLESARFHQRTAARIDFPAKRPPHFEIVMSPPTGPAASRPLRIEGDLSLAASASAPLDTNALSIKGTIDWMNNQARFAIDFDPNDALPATATLEAPSISLPSTTLAIPGYKLLGGSFFATWRSRQFNISLDASAQPLDTNRAPPLTLTLHGAGDTNSLRVETARIVSTSITADLSGGLAIDFSGRMLSDLATFTLTADLDRQSWVPLRGRLDGRAFLRRGTGLYPGISAELHGRGVRGYNVDTTSIDAQAQLAWPGIDLTRLEVQFTNDAVARATASLDLKARSIRGQLDFSGLPPVNSLPSGYSCDGIAATIRAEGPWADPAHSGRISITNVIAPHLQPMQVEAQWNGKRLDLDRCEAQLKAGKSRLALAGSAELGRNAGRALLTTLDLDAESGRLSLENAVIGRYRLQLSTNRHELFGQINDLRWRGTAGAIALDGAVNWPQSGRIKLSVQNIAAGIVGDFLKVPPPEITAAQLAASARWDQGPLEFSLSVNSDYLPAPLPAGASAAVPSSGRRAWERLAAEPWALSIQAQGGAGGVAVKKLSLSGRAGLFLSASGLAPVVVQPGRGVDSVEIKYQDPVKVEFQARPSAAFLEWLTQDSRFKFLGTQLDADVSGTIEHLRGGATFKMERFSVLASSNQPPLRADAITARLSFAEQEIALNEFTALVEGQLVNAQGKLPLPQRLQSWREVVDWRKASARFSAPQISLASIARFSTNYLSPQGTAQLELSLERGGLVNGAITVKGAASRPLPNVGPLQNIEAVIRLTPSKLKIESCSGLVGGAPVAVFGEINLPEHLDLAAARGQDTRLDISELFESLPIFKLRVRGDSVPLVRRSDFILRANFDLQLANTGAGPPMISGGTTFQDSYFLSDLKLLAPGSVDKPLNRPPYFSIEREPFAHWKLDVSLRGDKFLKVRSPFFTGTVSADFRLVGTAKEPIVQGTAKIDSGTILFPFANLKVQQGEADLGAANPYLPHLLIVASSRVYTYDVRVQIIGPANRPSFEFSSTPGLSPEQILLMLTSGEMPLNENAYTTQQRAGHVAMFVGKNILSRLGLGAGTEDRLIISTSPSEIEPGTQTYGFEYKLSDIWSVIGDYDQFGGLNLGLRWRFYSK